MTSQLKLSISASEIIAPREGIKIHLPSQIDYDAAKSSITLRTFQGRSMVAPVTLSSDSCTINVATDHLLPRQYQLLVNELHDTNKNEIVKYQTTLFDIKAFQAKIPSQLRVHHSTSIAVGEVGLKRIPIGEKAPTGFTYIEFVKAEDRQTGRSVPLAFDENGNSIDGERLLANLEKRKFEKYGNMDQSLFNHVSGLKPADKVNLVVWPASKVDLSGYLKPTDEAIKERPKEEQHLREEVVKNKIVVVETLKNFEADIREANRDDPFVYATLKAEKVQKLARSSDVGKLCLEDRSARLDLTDSLAIARAPQAHNLGARGAGIHVAVYEDGPRDLTGLTFAGRFQNDPPDSAHARLTSGIIRNTEVAPSGYAPDCELYSANSLSTDALLWAVRSPQACTVISQSFHWDSEQSSDTLSSDDILKDHLISQWPYPTIVQAAGNTSMNPEYVNHKGYNSVSVGNHNDSASAMSSDSVFKNPASAHGDREQPEIAANGTWVSAVGQSMSGTSFATPAVAGTVAIMQSVSTTLRWWPEACHAILFASADRNVSGGTWADDVRARRDGSDGAGALNAQRAVEIARRRRVNADAYEPLGWEVANYQASSFDSSNGLSWDRYRIQAPLQTTPGGKVMIKAAIAWDSKTTTGAFGWRYSELTVDFDLQVRDVNDNIVTVSYSYDNSYEIVEFEATPGAKYELVVKHWSGELSFNWAGIAWYAW